LGEGSVLDPLLLGPKNTATIEPETILLPSDLRSYSRLVETLELKATRCKSLQPKLMTIQ
jgi:hypothetical protein